VRGFQPFPTSFTYRNGVRLTIRHAKAQGGSGAPGEVVKGEGDELLIAAGDGLLRLIELQPEGKRRLPVRDYLNGAKLTIGEKFGI
ncbi:MAG TPA: hypothetical protein VGI80_05890, partial [Pyrinomonadaceae bacterium]|jgi:methionyl-tRNA formyltransferase